MTAQEYIEKHPWTIAGVIAAGLVLYWLYSSGSSQTAVVTQSTANTDPALQIAQLQLTGQTQALNEKLAEAQVNAGTAQYVAYLQAQLGTNQAVSARDVSLAGISAQENVQLSGQQSQVQLAQITSNANIAQTNAAKEIALGTAATYAHIADVNSATTIASYQAQVDIAQSHDAAAVASNAAAQKTEQKKSSNGLVSGIIGAAASVLPFLFSDGDMKTDIQTIGYDEKGRRWVQFRYAADPARKLHTGVIAQEILKSDPDAVSRHPNGYLMVNYGALH